MGLGIGEERERGLGASFEEREELTVDLGGGEGRGWGLA